MTTYNPPYYQGFVERYGFEKSMDLFAYEISTMDASQRSVDLADKLQERLEKRGVQIRKVNMKQFEQDVEMVLDVYKSAWESNWGFVPPTNDEFRKGAKEMKMILDPDFAYMAIHEGKAIGMVVTLPDINQILRSVKRGRLFPFGWYKLLFQKHRIKRVRIMLLGVIPEWRNKGLEAIFYSKMITNARKKGYANGEASWVLENNEEMNKGAEKLNGRLTKIYRVYKMGIE